MSHRQRKSTEHHVVLNYTEPSLEDYAYMSDNVHSSYGLNSTSNPPDESPSITSLNVSTVTAFSSSRSIPLPGGKAGTGRPNGTAPPGGSTRSFMSLTSVKPDPVGKPEFCPVAPASCHVYCCAVNDGPAVGGSTTSPPTSSTSMRRMDSEGDATTLSPAEPSLGKSRWKMLRYLQNFNCFSWHRHDCHGFGFSWSVVHGQHHYGDVK